MVGETISGPCATETREKKRKRMQNYYQILELEERASQTEIRSAYRKLVKLHHPDINPHARALERIQQINQAYDVLSNPNTRAQYNRLLQTGYSSAKANQAYQQQQAWARRQYAERRHAARRPRASAHSARARTRRAYQPQPEEPQVMFDWRAFPKLEPLDKLIFLAQYMLWVKMRVLIVLFFIILVIGVFGAIYGIIIENKFSLGL